MNYTWDVLLNILSMDCLFLNSCAYRNTAAVKIWNILIIHLWLANIWFFSIITIWFPFHPGIVSNAMADSDGELSQLAHYLNIGTDGLDFVLSDPFFKLKGTISIWRKRYEEILFLKFLFRTIIYWKLHLFYSSLLANLISFFLEKM